MATLVVPSRSAPAAAAATLARGALAAALIITAACTPRSDTKSASADSTLARDLALANTESTASQPQLADTAGAKTTTPAGPPDAAAGTPPAATPAPAARRSAAHHVPRHSTPASDKTSASASSANAGAAPTPAPRAPAPPLVAPSGTSFDVVVTDTVSTATAHVGDPVRGTVASNVDDASGTVVIPAGAAVTGIVATSSGPAHTPHLGVSFTSIAVGGQSYAVQGTITALPLVQSRRTARAAQVGEVGGGAVIGGLLGRAIGGKKSGGTAIGAIAGAAAGVAVADKTESHDAVLPRGAHVTLQLTAPVSVPQ